MSHGSRTCCARRACSEGARVAYLGANHPAFLESLFATASLGAIFVPLNARLSAAEIDFMLADFGRLAADLRQSCAGIVDTLDAATRPSLIAVDGGHGGCARLRSELAVRLDEPIHEARRSRRAVHDHVHVGHDRPARRARSSRTTTSCGTASTCSSTSICAATR